MGESSEGSRPSQDESCQGRVLYSEGSRPPQVAWLIAGSATGGFIGAILAVVVAKILIGSPCCCADGPRKAANLSPEPAAVEEMLAAVPKD